MHSGFDFISQHGAFWRLDILEGMITLVEFRVLSTDIVIWWPPTASNQVILRRIDGDAVQPGVKGAVTPEISKRTIGLDERFLSNILSFMSVMHEPYDQA